MAPLSNIHLLTPTYTYLQVNTSQCGSRQKHAAASKISGGHLKLAADWFCDHLKQGHHLAITKYNCPI